MILRQSSNIFRIREALSYSKLSSQNFIKNLLKNNKHRLLSTNIVTNETEYEPVIGLEVHAQLNLQTKLFSDSINRYAARPNSQVSPFDLSLPGSLPSLNKQAVIDAIRTGLALNCTIPYRSSFDRKHYFYADLPNGYQITQQREPIAYSGHIDFIVYDEYYYNKKTSQSPEDNVEAKIKRCRLKQIQLEQDSGKSLADSDENLVDLNRAGVALLEFVFEPELHTTLEVVSLVRELIQILKTLGTCSCKLEEGTLRVDANISVRKKDYKNCDSDLNENGDHRTNVDWSKLGTRTEVKNLNSFRFLREAVQFEIERQIGLLRSGEAIIQETLGWNTRTKCTYPLRDKEIVQDYRFMPEPNLPPIFVIGGYRPNAPYEAPPISDTIKPEMSSIFNSKSSVSSSKNNVNNDYNQKFSFSNIKNQDSVESPPPTNGTNMETEKQDYNSINLSILQADVERFQLPDRVLRSLDAYTLTLNEKHILVQDPLLRELFQDTMKLLQNISTVASKKKHDNSIFIFDFLYKLTSGLLDSTLEPINVNNIRTMISIEYLAELLWMLESNKISQSTAIDIIRLYEQKIQNLSPEMIVQQFNWGLIDDPVIIEETCRKVIMKMPKVAKQFAKKGVRKPRSMLIQGAQELLENRAVEEELWKTFEKLLLKK